MEVLPTNNAIEVTTLLDKGLMTFALVTIAIAGSIFLAGFAVAYIERRGEQFERELKK